jgi:hypothetical protein
LAAGKYQADSGVLADEFRTNQTIKNQVTTQNKELLNQAQLQNLAIEQNAATAREQNGAATRATTQEALRSITAKVLQNMATNTGMTLLNQMMPNERYNTANNQWEFAGGTLPLVMDGLVRYNPSLLASLYEDKETVNYQRDSKGKLESRTKSKTPAPAKIFKAR